jgi:predicted DCC family thiol-disulfide oxidoreductase YuxK
VRLLRRLDWRHRLEYVDVQDWATVQTRFPALEREAALGQIHVIRPDGQVFTGYEGMRHLARCLPLVAWLYPLLFLPGIRWLGPRVYRWVAARRYQLNRLFGGPICNNSTCR